MTRGVRICALAHAVARGYGTLVRQYKVPDLHIHVVLQGPSQHNLVERRLGRVRLNVRQRPPLSKLSVLMGSKYTQRSLSGAWIIILEAISTTPTIFRRPKVRFTQLSQYTTLHNAPAWTDTTWPRYGGGTRLWRSS